MFVEVFKWQTQSLILQHIEREKTRGKRENKAAAWERGVWQSVTAIDEHRPVRGPRWRAGAQIKTGPVGHYTAARKVSPCNSYWTGRFKEGVIKAEGNYTLLYVFPKPGLRALSAQHLMTQVQDQAQQRMKSGRAGMPIQCRLFCNALSLTSKLWLWFTPQKNKKYSGTTKGRNKQWINKG